MENFEEKMKKIKAEGGDFAKALKEAEDSLSRKPKEARKMPMQFKCWEGCGKSFETSDYDFNSLKNKISARCGCGKTISYGITELQAEAIRGENRIAQEI